MKGGGVGERGERGGERGRGEGGGGREEGGEESKKKVKCRNTKLTNFYMLSRYFTGCVTGVYRLSSKRLEWE